MNLIGSPVQNYKISVTSFVSKTEGLSRSKLIHIASSEKVLYTDIKSGNLYIIGWIPKQEPIDFSKFILIGEQRSCGRPSKQNKLKLERLPTESCCSDSDNKIEDWLEKNS